MKPQIVRCAFQLRNLRLRDLVGTGKVRRWKVHEGPFRLLPWLSRIRIPIPRYIRRDLSPTLALIWRFPCARPLPSEVIKLTTVTAERGRIGARSIRTP